MTKAKFLNYYYYYYYYLEKSLGIVEMKLI